MNESELQKKLGFTEADKAQWLEVNSKYYADPEQGWVDKLIMHAYPQRSAAVYVMPAYQSPISGEWIDTPSQRRNDFAKNNCRPWEGMEQEKKEAAKRAAYEEQAFDKGLEKTIEQSIKDLPTEKKVELGVI